MMNHQKAAGILVNGDGSCEISSAAVQIYMYLGGSDGLDKDIGQGYESHIVLSESDELKYSKESQQPKR
eukprot:scaffold67073_cov38-Attheya_sp.AAC.2